MAPCRCCSMSAEIETDRAGLFAAYYDIYAPSCCTTSSGTTIIINLWAYNERLVTTVTAHIEFFVNHMFESKSRPILEQFRINENREAKLSEWKNCSNSKDLSIFRMKML